ncbi:ESCO1/2 acetyl-transferase-domain-containing protein [Massariosphaeria phaeospora]|uniref:ESCO1/2 acetyl-transferase-domain-containing protein n=1 Tax=Massariosphaeria phaeospora TaxID=100035 RepID=A0A7C8MJN8_9PLEO|nr:ESCO1/2 acetyl-transferase-domain-containing protein [Massariosphaeria phaeospora]
MSSSNLRKPYITYSRQKKHSLHDEEPPTKRRRVEGTIETRKTSPLSSSPARDPAVLLTSSPKEEPAVFSDEPPRSTPPSSPPRRQPSPLPQTRRPVFSLFKRIPKPEPLPTNALSERSHNVQSPPKPPPKRKRLVQMQLDLVGELRKACKVCGMEYIPSNAEDAALHRKFHAMNVGGVDLTKAFVERLRRNQVWAGGGGTFIAAIGKRDTLALRNKASEVLKVVNTELGAVTIPDGELWSQTRGPTPEAQGDKAQAGKHTGSTSDRFKAYLYVQGQKCVGACLAERIRVACPVLDQDDASDGVARVPPADDAQSSSISIGTVPEPAMLGISRIWTSNLHRKQGIASRLLETARSDFLYGMTIDKSMVAFSQPTDSGGRLARKWFGRRAGWHVYVD